MIATLTVVCSGRDNAGAPTHEETVIANLALDEQVGIVLLPTAQQRGNAAATRPRAFGEDLVCLLCDDKVRVGKHLHRLRRTIMRASAAGISRVPLHVLRA